MRKAVTIWGVLVGVMISCANAAAQEPSALATQRQKASYGIGVQLAKDLESRGIRTDIGTKSGPHGDEVEFELIVRGMRDALTGARLIVSEKELRRVLLSFQSDLRRKQVRTGMTPADTNRRSAETFLAENRTKEGVITLPGGVQYRVVKAAGDGKKPADGDTVEVFWQISHIDGSEIESTTPGKPRNLKLPEDVIPGLAQALKLMTVGSKWQVFVPSNLAYGGQGNGSTIGPNEALICEVELVAIK